MSADLPPPQPHVEKNGFRWRGAQITRLEQFSDAVFAFALALLVVSTDLPRGTDELYETLRGFPAFGATFAMLLWIWYLHYQFFRRYGLANVATIVLNGLLLFLILFYVYPLRFLFGALFAGAAGAGWQFDMESARRLLVIYSAGFVAVFCLFALLYRQALRQCDSLALTPREIVITRAAMQAHLWVAAIGGASLLLAALAPPAATPIAGSIYFLIGPVMWWHWRRADERLLHVDRHRRIEDHLAGDEE
jgi:uncharacterized membrane protein